MLFRSKNMKLFYMENSDYMPDLTIIEHNK